MRPLAVVGWVVGGGKRDLRLVQIIVGRLGCVPGSIGVAEQRAWLGLGLGLRVRVRVRSA
eukprot:scaffold32170_cov38-Phaeocystis_antarctica.AAC.2